jgi:hypothetical protein
MPRLRIRPKRKVLRCRCGNGAIIIWGYFGDGETPDCRS